MRRMMYRIMEKLVKRFKAYVIINGESVGQVASQTLTSMQVINSVTNIPVIRPVACFDKLEIIELSKKIDTYDISILPYEDCCTVFVPRHPVINTELDKSSNVTSDLPFTRNWASEFSPAAPKISFNFFSFAITFVKICVKNTLVSSPV